MERVKKFLKFVADHRNTILLNTLVAATAVSGTVLVTSLTTKNDLVEGVDDNVES